VVLFIVATIYFIRKVVNKAFGIYVYAIGKYLSTNPGGELRT
jgi:hypothetical protein